MRELTFCFCLLMCSYPGRTQVVMNVQLPPIGITTKSQLWNLSLANTSANNILVQIEMNLTDLSNNQLVLSGTTKIFTLPVGMKQLQSTDILPITYNSVSPVYGVNNSPDGFLPVGQFSICYTTIKISKDMSERLVEECESIEVEPLSPPQLIMPVDSEYVVFKRPMFSWMPPSPRHLFNNLMYDWTLVEIMANQTAAEAVQQNIPLFNQQNLSITNYQYPVSAPELDSSKLYAWRITAKNNSSAVGTSEVWTFRFRQSGKPDTASREVSITYNDLSRDEAGIYSVSNSVVRFRYLNEINRKLVSIRLFDIGGSRRKEVPLDTALIPVLYGENFLQLDLSKNTEMQDKRMYLLELTNSKNEKWFLKFEFRQPE